MRHTRLTTLVGVLSSVVLLSQSLPAYAQNVQVNGGGESSAQQPAATPAPAPQVQVNNTPAPAPAQPPVVVNNVRSDSGNSMHKPAARLMVGGGTLFGVMYLSTVLGAAIASDICNADSRLGCREASWPIYIPIVGPFIQMGYISPPFGYTLFYIKGTLPPHLDMGHVYRGILPFFGLQFVGLLICAAFPDFITWLPRLMAAR